MTPRTSSQEPIAERVEARISASRIEAAKRRVSSKSRSPVNPPNSETNPLSPIMSSTIPGQAASTSTGASGVPQNPNVAIPHGSRKMPKPGEKNAPTFDPEKPEELGRFFERIEDWLAEDGIVGDNDKMKKIVKYLDADSEIQWKAFSKFEKGSFAEFKAQVMASYPRAEDVMKGSVTALKKRIASMAPIDVDERDELLTLARIMNAEVKKLSEIKPPVHTNRELVELFLSALTRDFAKRIAQKLSVHRLVQGQQSPPANRNPEDMYDIVEVIDMAKQTALESTNPFGKFLWSSESRAVDSSVKLEEAVARLTDTINIQTQHNKQVDQRLTNLQSFLTQPRPQPTSGYAGQTGYNRGYAPASNHVHTGPPADCFYCKSNDGHRISDCLDALKHLDMGWIKKIEGKLKLPDGSNIPRDGNKSMKEVVEALNKQRPGLIPMSKIQDKSNLYQETSMSSYSQTQGQSADDLHLRALLDVVQKLGSDRVLKLLNVQGQLVEDDGDEWNQNFD